MYTKEQETLKAAFTNFFGVAVSSSVYEGDQAKANAISLFTEELIKQGQNEDETVNIAALKPMLKANLWILKCRQSDIVKSYEKEFKKSPPDSITSELDSLIELMESYIKKI